MQVHSTGLKQEAISKYHVDASAFVQVPGQHLWAVFAMYKVNPELAQHNLDMENLINIEGPGCYWCEEPYSPAVASRPCPGEP